MSDDKNNKDNTQDKKDDAQVKNELSAIKAQATATNNPAELARLASAAASLASSTSNPELIEQIKNLQSTISKKEENAEQVISSKIASENLEGQGGHDPEALRKQQEHEERRARIEKNWSEYEKIEKDFDKELKERSNFLDQVINNPESLTEEQKRIARGEYRDEEEKKEAERKAQLYISGATQTYELQKDLNKSIEHEQEQINELKKKIEAELDPQKKEALLQKQQQHQTNIDNDKEKLNKKIDPKVIELDLERQKLIKAAEKSPELIKPRIKEHFKGNIDRYKEIVVKDPNFKGLDEMYELIKKADLEKELGVEKEISEYQKATNNKSANIEQSTAKQKIKEIPINTQDSTFSTQQKYGKGNIPPEVKNEITEKKIIRLGYEKDVQVINGKLRATQASQTTSNQIDKPPPTPVGAKFAARAEAMNKKNEGRAI